MSERFLIPFKVSPGAKHSEIKGVVDGVVQVKIAAPPVEGKANARLIEFLSETLGISKSSIRIVRGQSNRNKLVEITGVDRDTVIKKLTGRLF